tara:strand:+ start:91 stop:408 length:318 start_codon:yes stop_codon:yes gene_type:complete
MKLKRTGYNQTVVSFNNGAEVFFSYDTPVAGYSDKLGYIRTNTYYSKTTSRHINKYEQSRYQGLDAHFTSVNQEVIDNLASNIPTNISSIEHNHLGDNLYIRGDS